MRKHADIKKLSAIAALLIAAASCSLDYEDSIVADDMSEEIPNTVLINFTQINVQNGAPSYEITAEQGEFYQKKKVAELKEVNFREFDSTGATVTEGRAATGIYYTDTEDAEIDGGLYFYSAREKAAIESEYLYYDKEDKKINGRPEDTIVIRKDSGSQIEGRGFSIDLQTREMQINSNASGIWREEEDEE